MLTYSIIIVFIVLIQIIFSFKSYICSGQNEFIYIGFGEVIQLIMMYIIIKAMIECRVDISYQSIVFYFNLICAYYYFKCFYLINSKSVIYNKVIIKHASTIILSTMYCLFTSCYTIMVIGVNNTNIAVECTTDVFFEGFTYFVPMSLKLLWPFIMFQLVILFYTTAFVISYSSKKIIDLLSFTGLWFAILAQMWLFARWHSVEIALPIIYVLITIAGLFSNCICYFRENYQIPNLIKTIYMYKHGLISESILKMQIATYKMTSEKTKLVDFILRRSKIGSFTNVKMEDLLSHF